MGRTPGWADVDRILAGVRPPTFSDRDFPITAYGATETDATDGIARAIRACHESGGGRVVVPPGAWHTGAIRLESAVNLHVSEGATLLFSTDPAQYLPVVKTRYEGLEVYNYSPLIYANGCTDIAVTGTGTLDGQAGWDNWWGWFHLCDEDFGKLRQQAAFGIPVAERVYGAGHHLRSSFIQPYECTNVLIEGVTIVRSPFWEVHPVLCRNVTVQDVVIDTQGPNNDGVDIESCRSVVIRGCTFDAGDDCIALKSGREADGLLVGVPTEDVVIEQCVMRVKYGAITLGSDLTGGIRNVFVRDCTIGGPSLYFGLYIKTNATRGGFAENIYLKDVTISNLLKEVVQCNFFRGEGDSGPLTPYVRNVELRGVTVQHARNALMLRGYRRSPIEDFRLIDCSFTVDSPSTVQHAVLTFDNVTVNGRPISDVHQLR
ncbi:glycoside hydrolase family 28 protein [Kribbella sp. NBC_00889]|uniref:glycoside hydrolase family 28 protein n=1 Tax=Kribbella sp. NBC_00889 TaxID=2975974 RepID=UPI003870A3BA|nr:glycoside hydrolase family 28 protein [Kribbella sp. NBC_00889]